jgi:glucokinase
LRVLAGDIGATKSLIAIFEAENERTDTSTAHRRPVVLREKRYASASHSGLEEIVADFLGADESRSVDAAVFGIAGPIVEGKSRAVNLAWQVDQGRLAGVIQAPTRLINDFEAVGYGLVHLAPADLVALQAVTPMPQGPIALIGAGTGLGEGYLTWCDGGYRVHPSEGGHSDFAPRTAEQCALFEHLRTTYGHVSYERILSGSGFMAIYGFVVSDGTVESPAVRAEIDKAVDPAPVITRHALSGTDMACARTLDLFVSIYGAEAGNLALKLMPVGGLFVAGGIAPRIIDRMRDKTFVSSFRDKGRHAGVLDRIPIHVVMNPRVGLIGAAAVASRMRVGN